MKYNKRTTKILREYFNGAFQIHLSRIYNCGLKCILKVIMCD